MTSVLSLSAAELVLRDVGVAFELAPTGFDYDVSDDLGSRSGEDSLKSAYALEVRGRYSLARTGDSHGAVLGFGLAGTRGSYGGSGSWAAYELRGTAGYGVAMSDRLTVLAEAMLGLGVARLGVPGTGVAGGFTADGAFLNPGLQGSLQLALTDRLIATGTLGYRHGLAKLSADRADVDLTLTGLVIALGVEWRFSNRPFLLE